MEITKVQKELLDSFTCERLSICQDAQQSVQAFESVKGALLVRYLKERGEIEDRNGESAFYLIRNKDKLPLLFFSLKCGSLFSPFDVEEHEKHAQKTASLFQMLNEERDEGNEMQNALYSQLEEISVKSNIELSELVRRIIIRLAAEHGKARSKAEFYHQDEATDSANPILRVGETLPGVELMHFCANDNAREYWKSLNISHPMGEVLFWYFIIPTIHKIQSLAGCKYFYLFAADSTEDRSLINYYNIALKFEKPAGMIGTNKPVYDFCCEFMAQEINRIIAVQIGYFQHFNLDLGEVIA